MDSVSTRSFCFRRCPGLVCPGLPANSQSTDYLPTNPRFVLPPFAPLPLLATAARPVTARAGGGGGATGVAYRMLIVQVAPAASVAPQVVPFKVNNPAPLPIPATVSPVIATGVVVAAPLFLIVTTLVIGAPLVMLKVRTGTPATVPSDPLVTAVKANGPAATPLPERLTGVPVPVAAPMVEL